MSTTFRLLLLTPFLLFLSCSGERNDGGTEKIYDLSKELLGTWETVDYRVDYATYQGGDTSYVEHIREAEWGRLYGVRPPSTEFTADGKLKRVHRMRDGQVVTTVNGLWKASGDSLLVIEPNVTYTYLHELDGDRLRLSGVVDQDRDGQLDDNYEATYRLVSRTR